MYKFLPSFESKFETPPIAEGAYEQSLLRISIIDGARNTFMKTAAILNLDAPQDVVRLNERERFYQPSVNREFVRIANQAEAAAAEPVATAEQNAQAAVAHALENTEVDLTASQSPSSGTISLTQDLPNQAAINKALLRAMAAHDEQPVVIPEDLLV